MPSTNAVTTIRRRAAAAALLVSIALAAGGCGNLPLIGGTPAATGEPGASAPLLGSKGDAPADQPDLPAGPLPAPEKGDIPAVATTPVLAGHLALGQPGQPTTKRLGLPGGSMAAEGLTIDVPAGALNDDATWSVTATPVTGLGSDGDYGGAITPVTPLYAVSTGGGVLAKVVTVTLAIPASTTVPAGAIPMAFYYDPATGSLTPMAPVSADDTHIVAQAPHFSDVVGALVVPGKVGATVDSGFRPGIDDWEFTNYGSYVAPGGHCEGQSISEIWYYDQQRKAAGAAPLFGLYDNNGATVRTPGLQEDDSDGYRFASAIQAAPLSDLTTYLHARDAGWTAPDGRLTWNAFRAALALTGRPQLIRITTSIDKGGHTMVVYRASANRLFVADPNYPGRLRTIAFDAATGKLGPYSSGDNAASIAAGNATVYTLFAYVPWETSRSSATVASRWADFEAGTAGDAVFPAAPLLAQTGTDAAGTPVWAELKDRFQTSAATLRIAVADPAPTIPTTMLVYRGTKEKPTGAWGWDQTLTLASGENPYGLLVVARTGDKWKYLDFIRLTIVRGDASPTPSTTAAAGGHWVLQSAVADGPSTPSFSKAGETLKITSSDGAISVSYNYDGPPHRNERGSASWGPPPANAAPGDTWSTTLQAQGSCRDDLDLSWAMGVSVALTWTTSGSTQTASFAASATCEKGSASSPLSWAFPAHEADGDTIAIYVSGGEEHSSDNWTYRYAWVP